MSETVLTQAMTEWRAFVLSKCPDFTVSIEDDSLSPLAWSRSQGLVGTDELRLLAEYLEIPFVENLAGRSASAEFVTQAPISFAREWKILLLAPLGDAPAELAIGHFDSWRQIDVISRWLRRPVRPLLTPMEGILSAINGAYEAQGTGTNQLLQKLEGTRPTNIAELLNREDLLDGDQRAPVVQIVNSLLSEAIQAQASDIHLQPEESGIAVRFRLDGVLFPMHTIPKALQEEVLSRVKILGQMNIAEKRLPQDGRATVELGDRLVDLRIASLPTNHGERVVIRLLDKSVRVYSLTELGLLPETLTQFRTIIHREHGMILATGPTGSGKSTTLYAALRELNTQECNVLTLEDPIEYQLEGISQTQINVKKGLTFASGLRNVLRQDPDVIMVGEIRDHETAVMAVQSSLTGHLVFSTLHTNDAASAVTRLFDLGIEPYLVSSCLIGVLAQRLVRRNCNMCVSACQPTDEELRLLDLVAETHSDYRRGKGCATCRHTGYRGRFAISELLVLSESLQEAIQSRANAATLLRLAIDGGFRSLRHDGILKAQQGLTTLEEVAKVITTVVSDP